MSIVTPWRPGTGRRRMPDALDQARRQARTYRAACHGLADERDDLARTVASLQERCTWLELETVQARRDRDQAIVERDGYEHSLDVAARSHAEKDQQLTYLRAELANARAVRVPAPADAGGRDMASEQDTAAWDMAEAREELLLLAAGPGGEPSRKAADNAPEEDAPLEDTLTLPIPAAPDLAPAAATAPPKTAHQPTVQRVEPAPSAAATAVMPLGEVDLSPAAVPGHGASGRLATTGGAP